MANRQAEAVAIHRQRTRNPIIALTHSLLKHFFLFPHPLNHLPLPPPSPPSPACYIGVMATPAQITANRANAQKSTGPRSVEGKSASRFNALKHGIDAASIVIPGEDPADYDALVAQYHREYQPQSASESFHVDTMIRADWHKRRLAECRGRSLPHRPRRIARQLARRRAPRRIPRRQTPRPRAAPDRRLRTHLASRQYRTPPCPRRKSRARRRRLAR